jgi:hypothetical protein
MALDPHPDLRPPAARARQRAQRRLAVREVGGPDAGDRHHAPLTLSLRHSGDVDRRRREVARPHAVELVDKVDDQRQRLALDRPE